MGLTMRDTQFTDDDFLDFWVVHGQDWTWQDYAEAISDSKGLTGEDRLTAVAIRVRVHRRREEWRTTRGVMVEQRRVSTARVFAPWPDVDARYRDTWLHRFLELEAVVLETRSAQALPGRRRNDWRAERDNLIAGDLVIRYDPETGFYRAGRHAHEPYGEITETAESYRSRHPR